METILEKSIKKKAVLSVIVPAYNLQDYLEACIRSILAQTYKNLEILIIDDGATDGTGMIADRLQEEYPDQIHVFHKENTGVFDSRLYGVEKARGEWIAFVDGDDCIEPDMYERLIGNAETYGADISHCGYQIVVNRGERIHYFYNTGRRCLQNHQQGINDLLTGEFVEPSVCNKLYRRELFTNAYDSDLMDITIRYTEDLLLNYILFKNSKKSVYEDFCPYHYMARAGSATRTGLSPKRILDPVRVCERILGDGENGSNEVIICRYLGTLIGAFYNSYVYRLDEVERKALRNKLIAYKEKWILMRRADRIKLRLLMLSPYLYHVLYLLYSRFFQKKVYE